MAIIYKGSQELSDVNYQEVTKAFLTNYGMSENNINAFIDKLCK